MTTLANAHACCCCFHHLVSFPSCGFLLRVLSQPCFLTLLSGCFPSPRFLFPEGRGRYCRTITSRHDFCSHVSRHSQRSQSRCFALVGLELQAFLDFRLLCGLLFTCVLCCACRWLLCLYGPAFSLERKNVLGPFRTLTGKHQQNGCLVLCFSVHCFFSGPLQY